MNFSQKLQILRKQKKLSQEQLAELLKVSRQAVSKWESNQSYPDIDKLIILSDLFEISLDTLLKDKNSIECSNLCNNLNHEQHKENKNKSFEDESDEDSNVDDSDEDPNSDFFAISGSLIGLVIDFTTNNCMFCFLGCLLGFSLEYILKGIKNYKST